MKTISSQEYAHLKIVSSLAVTVGMHVCTDNTDQAEALMQIPNIDKRKDSQVKLYSNSQPIPVGTDV